MTAITVEKQSCVISESNSSWPHDFEVWEIPSWPDLVMATSWGSAMRSLDGDGIVMLLNENENFYYKGKRGLAMSPLETHK